MSTPAQIVTIRKLVPDWDMRRIHKLQEQADALKLRSRDVILAFNRRMPMGRLVDMNGTIVTFYAFEGMRFKVEKLLDGMELNLGMNLRVHAERVIFERKAA